MDSLGQIWVDLLGVAAGVSRAEAVIVAISSKQQQHHARVMISISEYTPSSQVSVSFESVRRYTADQEQWYICRLLGRKNG